MLVALACIVEGDGDVEAVPIAIRRIVQGLDPRLVLKIHHPIRVPRTKLAKPGELERSIELAARRAGRDGAIFVVLDSDDDCHSGCQRMADSTDAGGSKLRGDP
jgi:hypothetical protein